MTGEDLFQAAVVLIALAFMYESHLMRRWFWAGVWFGAAVLNEIAFITGVQYPEWIVSLMR